MAVVRCHLFSINTRVWFGKPRVSHWKTPYLSRRLPFTFASFKKIMSMDSSQTKESKDAAAMQNSSSEEVGTLPNKDQCVSVAPAPAVEFAMDTTPFTVVREGKTEILFPNSHDVFYNPVQEFNRDISIAVIQQFVKEHHASLRTRNRQTKTDTADDGMPEAHEAGKSYNDGVTVLEALAASGLRSVRYAQQVAGLKQIIANDISRQAVESIRRNVEYNKVDHLVTSTEEDASLLMYQHRKYKDRFHIIDLDPYGSPSAFLDAAVQAVHDEGLLMVTCTDTAILCGNSSETCYAKYGAVSLKLKSCHEMALRIILHSIETHAIKYGRYIEPLLSLSVDFYVRIFVKVYTSQAKAKQSASKRALVFHCKGCETFTLQAIGNCASAKDGKGFKYSPATGPVVSPECDHCGHRHQLGGPIWSGRIHDYEFVKRMLVNLEANPNDFGTWKRLQGILSVVSEELPDVPLYYSGDRLAAIVHSICPKMVQFRSAILNAGYQVSFSHALKSSIKTDAPANVIWDIMREWVKQNPIKRELPDGSPASAILRKAISHPILFTEHAEANPESKQRGLIRYQVNPEKYWGPKMRAKTSVIKEKVAEKRIRMQGKRSHQKQNTSADLKCYPCKRFKQGKCNLGEECRYSHDSDVCMESSASEPAIRSD